MQLVSCDSIICYFHFNLYSNICNVDVLHMLKPGSN